MIRRSTPRSRAAHAEEAEHLFEATGDTLAEWTGIRIAETGDGFPTKVTAFHPDMAVHGKFGQPCPKCEVPIQRIVPGVRETNCCPGCRTNGRILTDRALSKLLKEDRPKTVEDLERTADSRQQTADSRQQTADSGQRTADSGQRGLLLVGLERQRLPGCWL